MEGSVEETVEETVQENIEMISGLVETLVEFGVAYGFQILGALVVLVIGLKVAGWIAGRTVRFGEAKGLDITLVKFMGATVRILVIVLVVIITLGNFGITIAPIIAFLGAAALGASFALQGPLSNYAAGLSIILARPFVVGNTLAVRGVSGVVDEITLSFTNLVSEDGEKITIPNKKIVGEILVNSWGHRIVEANIWIDNEADPDKAIAVIKQAIIQADETSMGGEPGPDPQVGIHDFAYGSIVLSLRYWVPTTAYFQSRFAVNRKALAALEEAGIKPLPANRIAFATVGGGGLE